MSRDTVRAFAWTLLAVEGLGVLGVCMYAGKIGADGLNGMAAYIAIGAMVQGLWAAVAIGVVFLLCDIHRVIVGDKSSAPNARPNADSSKRQDEALTFLKGS